MNYKYIVHYLTRVKMGYNTLNLEGHTTSNLEAIKGAVQNFYLNLLKATEEWKHGLTIKDTTVIFKQDQLWLQGSLEEEEMLESIKSFASYMAPRFVDFSILFTRCPRI